MDNIFRFYNLKIAIIGSEKPMVYNHQIGGYFLIEGENLIFKSNQPFSMYSLAAIRPLLYTKQRETDPNDWMIANVIVACPDPHCEGRLKITWLDLVTFSHSETTGLPIQRSIPYQKKETSTHSVGEK